jgi:8-oxo-dGTP pyrophosphatase MutT (NUDIX family)
MPDATTLTLDLVRRALRQPLPGLAAQIAMAPPERPTALPPNSTPPREAGVLLLLYSKDDDALYFVLTRRTERLGSHSGQISFPGGRHEIGDVDFAATALREAHEELGIDAAGVEILGELTDLYIPPSHFVVHPVVAYAARAPTFYPHAGEVAEVIEAPLTVLFDPAIKAAAPRALVSQGGREVMTPFYRIAGHQVWGATAMILAEFEALLRATIGERLTDNRSQAP